MNRRSLIMTAGAVAISTGAFAQTRGAAPAAVDMGKPEADHIQQTMRVGSLSLATSRIAVQKVQNAHAKQFAQFEVAEQETIAEILKSMMQGAAATTGQSAEINPEAPASLDDKGKAALKKLQDAKSGAEFDKEYIKAQIDGHNDLLKIQENYIQSGKMREHVNVAKLARGQIKEHLVLLKAMKV